MTTTSALRKMLFSAIVAEVGREPVTHSERQKINRAVSELCEIGATPDDVHARSRRYREMWPHAVLTAKGLVGNWSLVDPTRGEMWPPTRAIGDAIRPDDDDFPNYNRA